MKGYNSSKSSLSLLVALALAAIQLVCSNAHAQSSYFTSRGCVSCHAAPTVATCAGCHHHSGTIAATTNKTSYAAGETVAVTMTSSGARTGWIGARLYDQSGAEIARSTGTQSGMGGAAVYPAVLSAPAPATAGTYTWKIAYFGNNDGTGTRDVHSEKSVNVSFTVAAVTVGDTTKPVIGAFTLPTAATSLSVPVSSLTATDNIAVTGYQITKSATAPAATAAGWTTTAPTSVTAVAGSNTFYAYAKDAAGNVSLAKSAAVTVTIATADTTKPVIGAFTLPATATSLSVPVSSLTATDNVAVTGYLVNTSATAPAATATGWSATVPASASATAAGTVTFYAWAKDAAGNVSLAKSASVAITLPPAADTTKPVISAFTLPATATSLTVPVTAFAATDDVAITGYLVNTSATAPAATATGWNAAAPDSVTAAAEGTVTFYAYAKDAAGNVSLAKSASVAITAPAPGPAPTPTPDPAPVPGPISGDITKPRLIISTLTNKAVTAESTLNVSGTASDANGIKSITVNGQAAVLNDDGTFSIAVTLVQGANTITTVATDNAGNQKTRIRTIKYDPVAPVISISSPTDNGLTGKSFLTIKGTVDEKARVSVAVNAKAPHYANRTGQAFTGTVYLEPGLNTVTVTAVDPAGNSSSAKRTITFDNNKPTLAVIDPVQDAVITQPQLILKGTVSDTLSDVTVSIIVDGQTYTPAIVNGEFQQALTFTNAGQHAIAIIAVDALGHKQKAYRNVIYRPDGGASTTP